MKFKNCLVYHLVEKITDPSLLINALKHIQFNPMDDKTLFTRGSVPPLAHFENGEPMGDTRIVIAYKNLMIFRVSVAQKCIPSQVLDYEVGKEVAAYKLRTGEEKAPLEFIDNVRDTLRYTLAKDAPIAIDNFYGAVDIENQLFYSFDANESYANQIINALKQAFQNAFEEPIRVQFITVKNYSYSDDFSEALTQLMIGPYHRQYPDESPDFTVLEKNPYLQASKLNNTLVGTTATLKQNKRQVILKNERFNSYVNRLRLAKSALMVEKIEICAMAGEASTELNNPNPRHMVCSAEFTKNGTIHNLVQSQMVRESIYNELETEGRDELDLIIFAFSVRGFVTAVFPALWHPLNIHLSHD